MPLTVDCDCQAVPPRGKGLDVTRRPVPTFVLFESVQEPVPTPRSTELPQPSPHSCPVTTVKYEGMRIETPAPVTVFVSSGAVDVGVAPLWAPDEDPHAASRTLAVRATPNTDARCRLELAFISSLSTRTGVL